MSKSQNPITSHRTGSQCFEIQVEEHMTPNCSDWFDGWTVTYAADGATVLTGVIEDQSALHGLLARIRDLNLTLISVHRISPERLSDQPPNSGHTPKG